MDIEGSEIPSVYDVEPDQNNRVKDISAFPKRSRFYHAIIDSRSLKSGEDFGKLKQGHGHRIIHIRHLYL